MQFLHKNHQKFYPNVKILQMTLDLLTLKRITSSILHSLTYLLSVIAHPVQIQRQWQLLVRDMQIRAYRIWHNFEFEKALSQGFCDIFWSSFEGSLIIFNFYWSFISEAVGFLLNEHTNFVSGKVKNVFWHRIRNYAKLDTP